MRRRVGAGALIATMLAVTGCAVAADPTWQPPEWKPPALTVTTLPQPLDATALGGLAPQRLRNEAVAVQARFTLVPAVPALDERVLAVVRAAIDARVFASGVAYTPQAFPRGAGLGDRRCVPGATLRPAADVLADPALGPPGGAGSAVVCDIVAAAGTVLGQRVRVVSGDAATVAADASTLIYADVATGAVASAAELWSADAPSALWSALVEALRRDVGSLSLAPVGLPDEGGLALLAEGLATTVPAPDGTLVFTLPAGFTAPELAALGLPPLPEQRVVGVPPSSAHGIVSPVGAALVAAASSGAPYTPPAAVPAGRQSVDCRLFPCVAVTYDDGPGRLTPGILDAYAARSAAATFFVLGQSAGGARDVVARMAAEGHEVGNHTWGHPDLTTLPAAVVARQVRDTTAVIEAATGQPVRLFRPPYGEYDAAVLAAAGLPAILWDVDTVDYTHPADDVLVSRAVDEARPGSIVLQHDIQPGTARTVGAVIDGLHDRGFRLVTVSQLFGGAPPSSGAWRSAR
jgi:peptidoglycan/xylan/chitin deacetylase (PgdA/CDA1 family)